MRLLPARELTHSKEKSCWTAAKFFPNFFLDLDTIRLILILINSSIQLSVFDLLFIVL